jgi:hypothetical protein
MPVTCEVATTTWNSLDLIGPFLEHYRALGFVRALVMDFDSTDGTRDVLTSAEWRGFVEVVPFPGIARLDSSNILLAISRSRQLSDWCLFCDPDELLVMPDMTLGVLDVEAVAGARWVAVPRFNMTGPTSLTALGGWHGSHVDALTLRIDRRQPRMPEVERSLPSLDPPWIFSAIHGKVLVRPARTTAIGEGDHVASSPHDGTPAPGGVYLLHYPFRTYDAFRDKVELARRGFAENPHLSQGYGWQVRRWVDLADAGTLHDEFVQQFIPETRLDTLIADGTIAHELAIARFHQSVGLRART